jgi:hypothetical protein
MGLFSGLGNIVGGIFGIGQGNSEKKMAKKAFKREDPFGPYRKKYAEELGTFMDDPTKFLDNPLYKAAFRQGEQATLRSGAGSGYLGSGNLAVGMHQFGQGFAWSALQEQEKFLAMLGGAGIDPDFGAALGAYNRGGQTQRDGIDDLFGGFKSITKFFGM